MSQRDLHSLAQRLDVLIESYTGLQINYQLLLDRQSTWDAERAKLIEQNRIVNLKLERLRKEMGQ